MRNNYPKSFIELKTNSLNLLLKKDILMADALIIDYLDAKNIFNSFDIYKDRFDLFKENLIQIFIKLDSFNLNKSYREIKDINPYYINGFALPHSSKSLLNKMTIKSRDFEHAHKLNFGTMRFIAYIDNPNAILNYRKIASYDRVFALYLDDASFRECLGLENDDKNLLREQIFLQSILAKKLVIDSCVEDNALLIKDLKLGKHFGTDSKMAKDLEQVKEINDFYTPKKEEIKKVEEFYQYYLSLNKKNRKYYDYKIIQSNIIRDRANEVYSDVELLDSFKYANESDKRIRPKKFYTFGEEVANAITHGLGVLMSLVFLIFLLYKGKGSGLIPNLAYVIFALSSFTLYISSTLYHGLRLGSKAKYLFHKFDRMSIYLLIAGTYTPLTLISIGGNVGIILFIILWVGSALGIFLNFYKFGKLQLLHMFLYVFLGWIAIFYIKTIINSLGHIPSLLVLFGGIAYTIGIIFYTTKLFKFTHMIWHLFTILGTILHFFAIYLA